MKALLVRVLQSVAVCCSAGVIEFVADEGTIGTCVPACCSLLQSVAVPVLLSSWLMKALLVRVLQLVAVCCSLLQCRCYPVRG